MAYYSHSSLAYNFALFEDERLMNAYGEEEDYVAEDATAEQKPGSKENNSRGLTREERKIRAKKANRRRTGIFRFSLIAIFGIAVAFIVVSIIHGQVQLTELNQEIANAKATLAEQQSVYTQLEMKVDSSISNPVVEEYAKDKLHMVKATNTQKEFVNLSEGDKAEVTMTSDKSIFESIGEAFSSLWS